MIIEKRYFDEDKWHEISKETAEDHLERYFGGAIFALEDIRNGFVIRTAAAEYRLKEETS